MVYIPLYPLASGKFIVCYGIEGSFSSMIYRAENMVISSWQLEYNIFNTQYDLDGAWHMGVLTNNFVDIYIYILYTYIYKANQPQWGYNGKT